MQGLGSRGVALALLLLALLASATSNLVHRGTSTPGHKSHARRLSATGKAKKLAAEYSSPKIKRAAAAAAAAAANGTTPADEGKPDDPDTQGKPELVMPTSSTQTDSVEASNTTLPSSSPNTTATDAASAVTTLSGDDNSTAPANSTDSTAAPTTPLGNATSTSGSDEEEEPAAALPETASNATAANTTTDEPDNTTTGVTAGNDTVTVAEETAGTNVTAGGGAGADGEDRDCVVGAWRVVKPCGDPAFCGKVRKGVEAGGKASRGVRVEGSGPGQTLRTRRTDPRLTRIDLTRRQVTLSEYNRSVIQEPAGLGTPCPPLTKVSQWGQSNGEVTCVVRRGSGHTWTVSPPDVSSGARIPHPNPELNLTLTWTEKCPSTLGL